MYVNKIENRITFKTKTGYYRERLTPEAMELLGSTKSKNGEDVPHLEINEVALVHCNVVKIINIIQESCIHLFQINYLVFDYIFDLTI